MPPLEVPIRVLIIGVLTGSFGIGLGANSAGLNSPAEAIVKGKFNVAGKPPANDNVIFVLARADAKVA
jgi:hypothetical protein